MTLPRVVIGAQSSGSGKTTITCGILQALVNRGMKVASFKCGPDYIDPMFHSNVIGTKSKNLDPFFVDDGTLAWLFERTAKECEISIIEGVMGYYDGNAIGTTTSSTCDVSKKLSAPSILIVDAHGAATSALATLKGFLEYTDNTIKGVIFNRMSEGVFRIVGPMAEEMGVKAVGYVPKLKDITLESRHLGLVMPSEIGGLRDMLMKLTDILEESLDIDMIIDIAKGAGELNSVEPEVDRTGEGLRIGLAKDETFCFTYEDNIELLRRSGAEIVEFSPMHDSELPDVDAIVLSGGYPEL
ncbi:MAG: cobyrinate a,c-diamide synthase, partial [Candidatus Methanomethylophilaceae archaeon]|nr:cobyrinate a,c-diamide synthase [Candidatus Methanomethylophilaceae archaeon]